MVVRCMLTHAGFEKLGSLWGEAICHAAHVTNITRMKQDRPSPQEKINDSEEGRLVEGAGLMVFGAKVSVHNFDTTAATHFHRCEQRSRAASTMHGGG